MASDHLPEWLPDGWIMVLKRRPTGKVDRYYTSPESGSTFRSKGEVMRYLNFEKDAGFLPRTPAVDYSKHSGLNIPQSTASGYGNHSNHNISQPVAQNDSPLWLPHGWIIEIKTRKTGCKAGRRYKCYFDPVSGSRFYSKAEVLRYLNGGKASEEERNADRDSPDNVLSRIECSPAGLPSGWIKELKFRRNSSGLRKDPYYTDPVSGYVFRSMKDVLWYLETGEISKYAIKPTSRSISTKHSIKESTLPMLTQSIQQGASASCSLFVSPTSSSSDKSAEKNADLSVKVLSFQSTPQCIGGCSMGLVNLAEANNLKEHKMQAQAPHKFQTNQGCEPDEHGKVPWEVVQEVMSEQAEAASEFSGSTSKKGHANMVEGENKRNPKLVQGTLLDLNDSCKAIPIVTSPPFRKRIKKLAVRRSLRRKAASQEILAHLYGASVDSSHNNSLEPEDRNSVDLPSTDSVVVAQVLLEDKHLKTPKIEDSDSERGSSLQVNARELTVELPGMMMTEHVTRSISAGLTKAKDKESSSLPRRASKRLAGLEPVFTADVDVSYRSLRKSKRAAEPRDRTSNIANVNGNEVAFESPNSGKRHQPAGDTSKRSEGKEPIPLDPDLEEKHARAAVQIDNEKKEPSFALPFGYAWPDPCIEFAFKTLTGDSSVFEDTGTIEDYFQQQMAKTTGMSDPPVQQDSINTTVNNTTLEISLKNSTKTCGDMNTKTVEVNN